jgi:hypothetical protein
MQQSSGKSVIVQGRIVWTSGDLFEGQLQTIFGTKQPKLNAQGQQTKQYGFGLAIPKSEFQQPGSGGAQIWEAMQAEAFAIYPSRQVPPSFAWKFKDGDGVDDKGVLFANRTGYAGHLVLSLTTSLPIKFFRYEGGAHVQVNDGIKCGDYVNVQVHVKAHGAIGQGKPGLYLNPSAVQFVAAGEPIINAPSAEQIFGNAMPTPPQGYVAPAGPPPMPTQQAPQQYAQPAAAPAFTQQVPAPHHGVLPPAHQPQAAVAPFPAQGTAPTGMPTFNPGEGFPR